MGPRALFAAVALIAAPAAASDLDQFGFGARPISMGGAFTALATDFTAAYYNPAGLAISGGKDVGAGFSYAGYMLHFKGDDGRFDRSTERQQPLSAFTLGVAGSLDADRESFFNRIALGLGLFFPARQIVGAEAQTGPGRPEFFLYGARRDKVGILPAVALRILPIGGIDQTLAIGAGATILADINGDFTFNLATAPASSVSTKLKLTYDVAPNVGIFWWPADWLSLGATYRGALGLKAQFDVVIDLDGDGVSDFPLDLEAITLYQPQQVAVGFAVDPAPWLTLALDVTWYNWSKFEDPFITIEPIVGQTDPNFKDIFVPRVGIELEPLGGLALRAGYFYEPSPVPKQDGKTTLVDNDKHVISFGVGWTYVTTEDRYRREEEEVKVEKVEARPFSIDLFFQWHHFVEQKVEKDDPSTSPVGASFRAGGDIFNGGFQVTLRF